VVGAVARRAVTVAVEAFLPREEPIERGQEVVIRTCADLDDHQPRCRVRHEDRQQAVSAVGRLGSEPGTRVGQVDEPATATGPDRQLAGLYGKMFRIASRSRPMPPPTGADSNRLGSPADSAAAPHWSRPTDVL